MTDIVAAGLDCCAQGFELQRIFSLALLQKTKAFPHHLARILKPARFDVLVDELSQMRRQAYISRRHEVQPTLNVNL